MERDYKDYKIADLNNRIEDLSKKLKIHRQIRNLCILILFIFIIGVLCINRALESKINIVVIITAVFVYMFNIIFNNYRVGICRKEIKILNNSKKELLNNIPYKI